MRLSCAMWREQHLQHNFDRKFPKGQVRAIQVHMKFKYAWSSGFCLNNLDGLCDALSTSSLRIKYDFF